MITIGSAQLDAWIAAYFFPLARILGFIATVPIWSSASIPARVKIMLGIGITVAIAPILPSLPSVQVGTLKGLAVLVEQMLIGIATGFAAKIVFASIDLAGEYIGFQMGLNFATFYDPLNSSQTPVTTEYISLLGLLVFLSINGHLMFVATLAHSFSAMPIGSTFFSSSVWTSLAQLGAKIFATGLLLALPVVVALMIINIALGVLTRAAPQLNLLALGFPLTLAGGLITLALSLNYLATPLQHLFEFAVEAMLGVSQAHP